MTKINPRCDVHMYNKKPNVEFLCFWLQFLGGIVCFRPLKVGNYDVWVFKMLSWATSLDIQQSMLKLTMTSNAFDVMVKPIDVNPIFQLWHIFSTSKVFLSFGFFPKYFKLA
jgi:hypothetical protein